MRKICTVELLSSRRVQSFRSIREEAVLNLIKTISSQKGSVVNLSEMIVSLTYSTIAQAAFGKKSRHQGQLIALMGVVIKMMGRFNIEDLYPSIKILERITGMKNKLDRLHIEIDEILNAILSEHRERRADSKSGNEYAKVDLVDTLLNIQKSGEFGAPITDDNLKGVILDVFTAGGETSAITVLWALFEMNKNPTFLQRAQDEVRKVYGGRGNVDESQLHELKFLHAVIKETLRMHPAAPMLLPRESSKECEINGYVIPAKSRVLVNAWAIGRDPMHWTEPEKFNPDRFLDAEIDFKGKNFFYIPFGAGRRICPGISFAFPSMELPLAQLLYHFDWKLPGQMTPEDLDLTEVFGLTVGPKNDLNLIPASIYQLSTLN